VWFEVTRELPQYAQRNLRHIEGPGFHATEPGGDGLVVWKRSAMEPLSYCLWEVKNYTGSSSISATIGGAYGQLAERATQYLAKLTGVASAGGNDHELAELYARLVDLWVDDSDRSGAGIAVGTNKGQIPTKAFTTMQKHFPGKSNPWQLEGLIAGIADFATFSQEVRRLIWTAL
jgi:hypothetical protein